MTMPCTSCLDGWKVHVNHIFVQLLLWLSDMTFIFLWLEFYVAYPKWLSLVAIACGNYN
jgi:hypothetical protein